MDQLPTAPSSQQTVQDENASFHNDIASSPVLPSSRTRSPRRKEKRPPPITPKRFTRFFTPRSSSGVHRKTDHISKSGRQLRDITRSALNRRAFSAEQASRAKVTFPDLLVDNDDKLLPPDPISTAKKRKVALPSPASSPLVSSPCKRIRFQVLEDEEGDLVHYSSDIEHDDTASSVNTPIRKREVPYEQEIYPEPVRRARTSGINGRLVERTFGGQRALGRGRRMDHCTDWRSQVSDFYSRPEDHYKSPEHTLPMSIASCNTNSVIAFGEEEGGVNLLDTSDHDGKVKRILRITPHVNAVMDIAFSSDDMLLATASGDQTAHVIDIMKRTTKYIMQGHRSSVRQVRFQPGNDNVIATSGRDGSVLLWDLRCKGRDGPVKAIHCNFQPGEEIPHHKANWPNVYNSILDAHAPNITSDHSNISPRDVSVTALQFLPQGRENLILTGSDNSASVKMWDMRGKYTQRRGPAIPVSTTEMPQWHSKYRNFGISSLVFGSDGARFYAVCKDSTVYAYSTNHLVLGGSPDLARSSARRNTYGSNNYQGLGPIYGFRHPSFRVTSFYVKAAMRTARDDHTELLAVGSGDQCPVVFATDETYMNRQAKEHYDRPDAADLRSVPHFDIPSTPPVGGGTPRLGTSSFSSFIQAGNKPFGDVPIYEHGAPLVRGHTGEVTAVTWTHDGNLISVGDDMRTRCWRQDADAARDLRLGGEKEGRRWGCGWAECEGWDDDE